MSDVLGLQQDAVRSPPDLDAQLARIRVDEVNVALACCLLPDGDDRKADVVRSPLWFVPQTGGRRPAVRALSRGRVYMDGCT